MAVAADERDELLQEVNSEDNFVCIVGAWCFFGECWPAFWAILADAERGGVANNDRGLGWWW